MFIVLGNGRHFKKLALFIAKEAEAVIHVLCCHPLYLNSPDINYLLTRQPDLFRITDIVCGTFTNYHNALKLGLI